MTVCGSVSADIDFGIAGLAAGATEAVAVVTPMEVVKIRLQAQHHSMSDPLDVPRYRNAAHAAYTVVREEGFRTLYRGVSLTALRQSTNQAVNFTAYTYFKQAAMKYQPRLEELPSYQHMVLGLVSGAMGPLSNAPIDTISESFFSRPLLGSEQSLMCKLHRDAVAAKLGNAWRVGDDENHLHLQGHVQARGIPGFLSGNHT